MLWSRGWSVCHKDYKERCRRLVPGGIMGESYGEDSITLFDTISRDGVVGVAVGEFG